MATSRVSVSFVLSRHTHRLVDRRGHHVALIQAGALTRHVGLGKSIRPTTPDGGIVANFSTGVRALLPVPLARVRLGGSKGLGRGPNC